MLYSIKLYTEIWHTCINIKYKSSVAIYNEPQYFRPGVGKHILEGPIHEILGLAILSISKRCLYE